jgi:hypothetical protein
LEEHQKADSKIFQLNKGVNNPIYKPWLKWRGREASPSIHLVVLMSSPKNFSKMWPLKAETLALKFKNHITCGFILPIE